MEKLREQKTVELRVLAVGKQIMRACEQVLLTADDEAQKFARRVIPPIKAELVHVGDEPEPRLDRFIAVSFGALGADVVKALLDRGLAVALAVLRRVEVRGYILEFADHLRDVERALEPSKRQVRLARSAPGARTPHRVFRDDRMFVGFLLSGLGVAPQIFEERRNERTLGLRFAKLQALVPK